MNKATPHRFHRSAGVRFHAASRRWTICIGKQLDRTGTKLRPKDWYWGNMTETDANELAQRTQADWEQLVKQWEHRYGRYLRLAGKPFADVPHWQTPETAAKADALTEREQIAADAIADETPTAADYADAYADLRLAGCYSLYDLDRTVAMKQGDIQRASYRALMKSIRSALTYFPADIRIADLNSTAILEVKTRMLDKLSRRTVSNRLIDLRRMLKWFYDSDYGQGHKQFPRFNEPFSMTNAVSTDIQIYSPSILKDIIATATEREQLYLMLGLNCGMYAADIGRLTLDEVAADNSSIFWDREKQPTNPFRVQHLLWDETKLIVGKFIQRQSMGAVDTDYRNAKPISVDCSRLAFVDDNGRMLYRITANGRAYDKIGKAMGRLNERLSNRDLPSFQFHSLRKSTNQLLCEQIHGSNNQLTDVANELSAQFLGQANPTLTKLYRVSGAKMYVRMNHYLNEIGSMLRQDGVFNGLRA